MRAALLFLALGSSACNSSTPTAPTPPPAPSVSPLPPPIASSHLACSAINGSRIDGRRGVQMTARAVDAQRSARVLSEYDGNDRHVTWSVDPAGIVAVVDRHGRVTPHRESARLRVTRDAWRQARRPTPVRVLPDYSGTWNGEFVVTGCTGGFDFRECGRIMFPLVGRGTGCAGAVSIHAGVVAGSRSGDRHAA